MDLRWLILITLQYVKLDDAGECPIEHCRHCTTPDKCSVCTLGWFGEQCEHKCNGNNSTCSICSDSYLRKSFKKFDNVCFGCSKTEYIVNGTCKTCPQNCVSCIDLINCTKCKTGYFGLSCQNECPGNCVSCKSPDLCTSCKNEWQGSSCQCSPNCLKEGNSSEWCNENGTCTKGCITGKRGSMCDLDCLENDTCIECDQYTNRCLKCSNGWHGAIYCNETCGYCFPDSKGDIVCNIDGGTCNHGCADGYYGQTCNDKCENCLAHTQDVVVKCNSTSEKCNTSCFNGFFGTDCEKECSPSCFDPIANTSKCDKESGKCIYGCIPGMYGERCDMNCSVYCSNNTCNQSMGQCMNGCIKGWYGLNCTLACSDTCLIQSCNISSGYCDVGCESGWFGDSCQDACNMNCANRSCSRESGLCDNECFDSINGTNCSRSCIGKCKDNSCDRHTSWCILGCETGYEGLFCNETMQTDFGSMVIVTNAGIAGALIVFSLFFVVSVAIRYAVCPRRRRNINNSTKENVESIYDEICENTDEMAILTNCMNEDADLDIIVDSEFNNASFSRCNTSRGDHYGKLIDTGTQNNEYTDLTYITVMNSRTPLPQLPPRTAVSKAPNDVMEGLLKNCGGISPMDLNDIPRALYGFKNSIGEQIDSQECNYIDMNMSKTDGDFLTRSREICKGTQQDWKQNRSDLKLSSSNESDQNDYLHPVC